MKAVVVKIAADEISDWDSFHKVFADAMGFPDFYGKNMDAWIDCMSYLDDPNTDMTTFFVGRDEVCVLELKASEEFSKRNPEIFFAMTECTAFVNQRAKDAGRQPLIALAFI